MGFGDFWLQSNNKRNFNLDFEGKISRQMFNDAKQQKIFDFFDQDKDGEIATWGSVNEVKSLGSFLKTFTNLIKEDKKENVLSDAETMLIANQIGDSEITSEDIFKFLSTIIDFRVDVKNINIDYDGQNYKRTILYEDNTVKTDVFSGNLTPQMSADVKENPSPFLDYEIIGEYGGLRGDSTLRTQIISVDPKTGEQTIKNVTKTAVTSFSAEAKKELDEYMGLEMLQIYSNIYTMLDDFISNAGNFSKAGMNLSGTSKEDFERMRDNIKSKCIETFGIFGTERLSELDIANATKKFREIYKGNYYELLQYRLASEKYHNALGLKQRLDMLKQGLQKFEKTYREQPEMTKGEWGKDSYLYTILKDILKRFLNNDEDAAQQMMDGLLSKYENKRYLLIDDVKSIMNLLSSSVENELKNVLSADFKRSKDANPTLSDKENLDLAFKFAEKDFRGRYKRVFGEDDPTEAISKKIGDAAQITSCLEIGSVILAQSLLGLITMGVGSSALTSLMSSKLFNVAVMFAGNYGVKIIDQATSDKGLNSERALDLLNEEVHTLPFLLFATYIAGPVAERLGKAIQATGAEAHIFSEATNISKNGIKEYTVSATKFFEELGSNNKLVAEVAKFGSEVGMFGLFDAVTSGNDIDGAMQGALGMQVEMKTLGLMAQVLTGQKFMIMAKEKQFKNTIENSELKDYTVTLRQSPNGNNLYTIKDNHGKVVYNTTSFAEATLRISGAISSTVTFDTAEKNLFNDKPTAKANEILSQIFKGNKEKLAELEQFNLSNILIKKTESKNGAVYEIYKNREMIGSVDKFDDVVSFCSTELFKVQAEQKFSQSIEGKDNITINEVFQGLYGAEPTEELNMFNDFVIKKNGEKWTVEDKNGKKYGEISSFQELQKICGNIIQESSYKPIVKKFEQSHEMSASELLKEFSSGNETKTNNIDEYTSIRNIKVRLINNNGTQGYLIETPDGKKIGAENISDVLKFLSIIMSAEKRLRDPDSTPKSAAPETVFKPQREIIEEETLEANEGVNKVETDVQPAAPDNKIGTRNGATVEADRVELKPFVPGLQVKGWLNNLQKAVDTGSLTAEGKTIELSEEARAIIKNAIDMVNEGRISENVIRALMSRKAEGLWEDAIQYIKNGTTKEDLYKIIEKDYADVTGEEAMYDLFNNYGIEEKPQNAKKILIQKRYESMLQQIEDVRIFKNFVSQNTNNVPLSVVRHETGSTAINEINIGGKPLALWLQECAKTNDYSALCDAINGENPEYTFNWMAGTSLDKNFEMSGHFKWNITAETGDAHGIFADIIKAPQYADEVEWLMAEGTSVEITRAWVDKNGLLNLDARIKPSTKASQIKTKSAKSMFKHVTKMFSYRNAESISELYKQFAKFDKTNTSQSEFDLLFKDIDTSPENIAEFSKLLKTLKENNGNSKLFKELVLYSKQEQKSPAEINSLIETLMNTVKNKKEFFKNSIYSDSAEIIYVISEITRDKNIEDINNLLNTYYKYYGAMDFFAPRILLNITPEYINDVIDMMNNFSTDPELKNIINIATDTKMAECLINAKDKIKMACRMKAANKLIVLNGDNRGNFGRGKTEFLQIEDNDLFDNHMKRFSIIVEKLNGNKRLQSKEFNNAVDFIELDDAQFESITKRNLWKQASNASDYPGIRAILEYAKLTDEEFSRFSSRNIEINENNVYTVRLSDTEYSNYKKRNLEQKIERYDIEYYAKMSDADWNIVEKYQLLTAFREKVSYLLSKGENAIALLHKRNLLDQAKLCGDFELTEKYINLSEEEFQVIKERQLNEIQPNRQIMIETHNCIENTIFSFEEMDILRTLSEKDWQKAKLFLNSKRGYLDPLATDWNRYQETKLMPFSIKQILELIKLPDSDIQFILNSRAHEELCMDSLRAFVDIIGVLRVSNIEDMPTSGKKRLASILVKHNVVLFNEDLQNFVSTFGETVIPKTQQEYCKTLSKCVSESMRKFNPVSKAQQVKFETAVKNMSKQESAFLKTDLEAVDFKLNMEYPREQFMQDIMSALDGLSTSKKQLIMDYYGFEVYTKDGQLVISGYPSILESEKPYPSEAGKKVHQLVEKFTKNNKVSVKNNPELSGFINEIFETFPELKSIIGKVQHGIHSYSVDVHTLKVLQGVMLNPEFKTLSESEQKILTISTLMHDISKKELEIDKLHPQNSATEAYQLLSKMDLTPEERKNIYAIIKHHDWLEQYNKEGLSSEEKTSVSYQIAYALKDGNNFKMASMLAEADLKGVQRESTFFYQFKDAYEQGVKEISQLVQKIKSTSIYIPQDHIPKASQVKADGKIIEERVINGHRVKILHLKKAQDLSRLGFPDGMTTDNLQFLFHGIISTDDMKNTKIVETASNIDSDIVLSTSIYNTEHPAVYAPYGYVGHSSDIIAATPHNMGSGRGADKIVSSLVEEFINITDGRSDYYRNYFSNQMKTKLKLTDKEYANLYEKIANLTTLELEQQYPEVAKVMEEIRYETEQLRQHPPMTAVNGQAVTEALAVHFIIDAIGCFNQYGVESMPEYWLQKAEDSDLLIITGD